MENLVKIPNCTVSQLVEKTSISLGAGELSLLRTLSHFAPGTDDELTLKVSELVFPLTKDHPIFTHAKNPQWYFFETPVSKGSYIQVELPKTVTIDGSEESKLQDKFEDALVNAGLLKAGIEAAGDEIGASVRQDAAALSNSITSTVNSHTASYPPTSEPTKFSPTTHSFIEGTQVNTAKASSLANKAAESFTNFTVGVGEKVVGLFGGTTKESEEGPNVAQKLHDDLREAGYPVDEADQGISAIKKTGEAAQSASGGISDGASSLRSAVANGADTLIRHDYGDEAADLASKTAESASNVGNVFKQAAVGTSAPYQGVKAAAHSSMKTVVPESEVYTV